MLGLGGQYSFQGIHVRTDSVNMEIDDGLLAFRTFLFITLNISHQYIRDFFADNKGATLRMPSDGLIIFRESSAKDRIALERLVSLRYRKNSCRCRWRIDKFAGFIADNTLGV